MGYGNHQEKLRKLDCCNANCIGGNSTSLFHVFVCNTEECSLCYWLYKANEYILKEYFCYLVSYIANAKDFKREKWVIGKSNFLLSQNIIMLM